MKIVKLEVENIKKVRAVSITPTGPLIEITGKNRAGKSSTLDAIWWAMTGTSHVQAEPIRAGEETARIRLDLGDLVVTRTFARKEEGGHTTKLVVASADGGKFSNPQTILDAIIGELTFDPLALLDQDPKAQVATLKGLVPGLDFTALDKANVTDFEERKAINREAKDLRARAAAINLPEDFDGDEIDEAALVAQLEAAGETNASIERDKAGRQREADALTSLNGAAKRKRDRAIELRREADELALEAGRVETEVAARQKALDGLGPLGQPIDTAVLRAEIANARERNAIARQAAAKFDLVEAAEAKEKAAAALTQAMTDRNAAKTKAISEAKMPVDGLGLDENGLTLRGFPFDQASDAEQLEAAVAIAAAMNPRLRVIRVRDGSKMDGDAMKALAAFADSHDMQVWVETVASGRPGAVVIEDGLVVGAEAPAKAEAEAVS